MQPVGIHLMPAGRDWDAVRVSPRIGLEAHQAMGDASRAVICDSGGQLYWLLPPGTASTWDVPHTESLGLTIYVVVPHTALTAGPGDHWERPPGPSGYLTDPDVLCAALLATVDRHYGPRMEPTS